MWDFSQWMLIWKKTPAQPCNGKCNANMFSRLRPTRHKWGGGLKWRSHSGSMLQPRPMEQSSSGWSWQIWMSGLDFVTGWNIESTDEFPSSHCRSSCPNIEREDDKKDWLRKEPTVQAIYVIYITGQNSSVVHFSFPSFLDVQKKFWSGMKRVFHAARSHLNNRTVFFEEDVATLLLLFFVANWKEFHLKNDNVETKWVFEMADEISSRIHQPQTTSWIFVTREDVESKMTNVKLMQIAIGTQEKSGPYATRWR